MIETLEHEETVEFPDAPRLLVEWSSPWDEFVTSIRPALSRSGPRLAGEAPYGMCPYRGMFASWGVEVFLLLVAIVVPMKIAQLRPYVAPRPAGHDVLYYSGDELPRVEDLGGAQSGTRGRAGGSEAHHRTQTIRIARGGSLAEKVVDAPNLRLPASSEAVANLLAIRPDPGPPPVEGLRSSWRAPGAVTLVPPAPNVIRDYTRGSMALESVVPPAPRVSRDRQLPTPALDATVIAPAPSVSRDHTLVAPALGAPVVAPAPSVSRDQARASPALATAVVPPAPSVTASEVSRSPAQMTNPAVVPPPVSSPERESSRSARLTMPAPSIIAPPPATDVSPDLHRLASGTVADPAGTVVPPPPASAGNSSFFGSILGKILGTTDVVAPPPTVSGGSTAGGNGASLSANVVPPPPGMTAGSALGDPNGARRGTNIATNIVPPPPSVAASRSRSGSSGAATPANIVPPPPSANPSSGGRSNLGSAAAANVIPPPPAVSSDGGVGDHSARRGAPGGTLLAENVVPPPPSLGGGAAPSGLGAGTRGSGFGGALSAGSVSAPPSGGGSGGSSALVVSDRPGSKIALPKGGGSGSLALSPGGADKPGLDGNGGGSGIGHGNGPGSGLIGEGSGAGNFGAGRGSDPTARGGISPASGPGGAGSASTGKPVVPGVSVSGGSTVVTLPSFGSDGGASAPVVVGRSSVKEQQGPAITIVATSRSGGAFNFYGKLPGDNYTIYVPTSAGTMVMQFADPASASRQFSGPLTGPQPLRSDLPASLPNARVVIACVLDASGNLKSLHVLEPGPPEMTAKILAALHGWKFRPAMRGAQPVEVNAILGFGIDTNDRF
jgi:hypothetical protein